MGAIWIKIHLYHNKNQGKCTLTKVSRDRGWGDGLQFLNWPRNWQKLKSMDVNRNRRMVSPPPTRPRNLRLWMNWHADGSYRRDDPHQNDTAEEPENTNQRNRRHECNLNRYKRFCKSYFYVYLMLTSCLLSISGELCMLCFIKNIL